MYNFSPRACLSTVARGYTRVMCGTCMNLYNHTVVLLYMTSCSCVRKNACLSGIEQFIVFRCPQLISIYCRIVQYVVSDRPSIRLYSVYKNNQLRLPSLYAMIILLLFYVAHILCQLLLFSTPF